MGLFAETWADARSLLRPRNVSSWSGVSSYISGRAGFPDGKYTTYATEGYSRNALVFACIEELSTSAAEPVMQAMQANKWYHAIDGSTSQAGRLLSVLDRPNPFMDSFEFWATVILHRSIAGNAYGLKVRSQSGRVVEIWLLRPDRVSIVPSAQNFIERYEYNIGDREPIRLPVEDVIHWKTRNPLNDFFGMPPLAAIAGNVDLDNYSRDFVKTYFEKAGVPSAILTTKQRMNPDLRKEIGERFSREHGGRDGWMGLLVIDGAESSYTPMTQSLGAQGLVLPELNEISESRISMAFGVPMSLIGTLAGAGNSSYGNKKSERESFWNETLKPLYRELVGPLNRVLVPDFPGVQQVTFDLSTVGALLPDQDALWARVGKALTEGLVGHKESRRLIGLPEDAPDDVFYIPTNLAQTPAAEVGEAPEPAALPPAPEPAVPSTNGVRR